MHLILRSGCYTKSGFRRPGTAFQDTFTSVKSNFPDPSGRYTSAYSFDPDFCLACNATISFFMEIICKVISSGSCGYKLRSRPGNASYSRVRIRIREFSTWDTTTLPTKVSAITLMARKASVTIIPCVTVRTASLPLTDPMMLFTVAEYMAPLFQGDLPGQNFLTSDRWLDFFLYLSCVAIPTGVRHPIRYVRWRVFLSRCIRRGGVGNR
jgi:hypothetical protein